MSWSGPRGVRTDAEGLEFAIGCIHILAVDALGGRPGSQFNAVLFRNGVVDEDRVGTRVQAHPARLVVDFCFHKVVAGG